MTKQDFEMIADTLTLFRGNGADELLEEMAEVFAQKLSNRNGRFNYSLFMARATGN